METIVKTINLGVGVLKGLLFGILAINTIGVILSVVGVAFVLSGQLPLGIVLAAIGLWIMLKTDDKL